MFAVFAASASSILQKNVTINMKNASVKEILFEIKKQTGLSFLYNQNEVDKLPTVTINLKDEEIHQVLDIVLKGSDLSYKIEGESISIISNKMTRTSQDEKIVLKGKIIDEDKKAIGGVTIIVLGTTNGAISDAKGEYTITMKKGEKIEISFMGMLTQVKTITASDNNMIIEMKKDAMIVDDVVVTGFFPRKKSGFAGTVTTIKKEDLQKVSTGNIFTTISTLDAGFKINEDNINGSNPNKLPDFTIRGKGSFQNGSTSPIFIVDGFETTSTAVFDMDINRIETITLLKDASATILYGSRASNGVIVIETIAPKPGNIRVTYDFKPTIGFVDLSGYDIMNAKEKLEYERLAGLYNPTEALESSYQSEQKYYERYKNVLEGVDTYWLSQPVQTSFSHAHSLFVEGGASDVRYSIDAGYNGNSGVMKKSGRDVINLGFSLIYRIKDKVTIKNRISYGNTNAHNSPYGSYSLYSKLNPYERIRDDKGDLILLLSDGKSNPLYDSTLPNRSFDESQTFTEQLNIDWFIINGLRFIGQAGITKSNNDSEYYTSPLSSQYAYSANGSIALQPVEKRGELSMGKGDRMSISSNFTLNYNKTLNLKHIIYAGIGGEIKTSNSSSSGYILTGFPDDRYSDPSFAIRYKENSRATSNESQSRSVGFFGNANYIFDDRFFADLSFRYDGSSQFGAENKFAPFWSVGTGWNIHNEKKWLKGSKIDMLKLRFSYGITGNQEFSAYQAKTMYKFNVERLYDALITSSLMGYGNPLLKWQNQNQLNIGLDFGVNKGRFRASINVYNKTTNGMLTSISVAPSIGLPSDSFTSNLGKIRNIGIEGNLNAVLIRKPGKDFEWSCMLQIANNKNTILKISDQLKNINASNNLDKINPRSVYEEGESMSALKAVKSLGIDPVTGQEVFVKKNGEITYTWDANDKILCGDTEPVIFGNFGTNIFYKGWNLNASFRYRFGADYYNSTLAQRVEGADPKSNADRRVLNDRWKTPGENARYKNISEYKNPYISTRFIQKEQLVQLGSLSLSYDFNKAMLKKYKINSFRLSCYANDILRVSTIKNERGLDYPFQRSFVLGLNIGF